MNDELYIMDTNRLKNGGVCMLLNVRLGNIYSFDEITEFTLIPGRGQRHKDHIHTKGKHEALKFTALYGANASGKSNFIRAIQVARAFILGQSDHLHTYEAYNKSLRDGAERETVFEFDFVIDEVAYSYGFALYISKKKIIREWLYAVETKEDKIYTRELRDELFHLDWNKKWFTERVDQQRMHIYDIDMAQMTNRLFLYEVNRHVTNFMENNPILHKIYSFFENIEIITPHTEPKRSGFLHVSPKKSQQLAQFLQDCGTGIRGLTRENITKHEFEREFPSEEVAHHLLQQLEQEEGMYLLRTPRNLIEIKHDAEGISFSKVLFIHEMEGAAFTLGEESDGTVRLIELYDVIANKKESIRFIDEIDRSLHPNLTYSFIERYIQEANGQLIVTTHEDRILELDLLRRDEVWFVEKNEQGISKLFSLEEYKVRFDKNIWAAYLDGRYGGVPVLSR